MDIDLLEEVKLKSTQELKNIVINFYMHRGALVAAAKEELTNRGVQLSDGEIQKIQEVKNKRKQEAISNTDKDKGRNMFSVKWKENIVDDVNAPQLYSRQVINIFSISFSVLFGGILLAINLKKINNKKGILPVLVYSFLFTALMIYLFSMISDRQATKFTLIFNLLGGMVLYNFFWEKYIGKEFKYRTKPFWIPLIIGITICGLILWLIIASNQI